MKLSLYLISLVIFLGSCTPKSSQSEQSEEQQSESSDDAAVQEVEPTISGSELVSIINKGTPIPARYISGLIASDQTYEAAFENLYEDEKFITGKLTAQPVSMDGTNLLFLCSFNKSTGKLLSSIPVTPGRKGNLQTTYTLHPFLDSYKRFWLVKKTSSQEVSEGQYMWDVVKDATTYEYAIGYRGNYELLDSAAICYEWLQKHIQHKEQIPYAYLAGADKGLNGNMLYSDREYHLEPLGETNGFLHGKLMMKTYYQDDTVGMTSTFFSSFSKATGKIASFVLLGVYQPGTEPKPDEFTIEYLEKGEHPVFQVNVKEFDRSWPSGSNDPVIYARKDETTKYYMHDYGQLSTKEYVSKEMYSFLDFIARIKKREDVSAYQEEDYYYSFMTMDYGGPVTFTHLVGNDKLQIFRAIWGEAEATLDRIWVYDNTGKRISECGGLPGDSFGIQVSSIEIDTVSLDPVVINFVAGWTEYEVIDTGEMPERGNKIKDVDATYQLTVNNEGKCKLVRL